MKKGKVRKEKGTPRTKKARGANEKTTPFGSFNSRGVLAHRKLQITMELCQFAAQTLMSLEIGLMLETKPGPPKPNPP
jgi:hypothetical protein